VQGAARRTHSNKFRHHEAPTGRFGGSAENPCGAQTRAIPRTTHKSGEYRRIRGRTYCPGAAIRATPGEFQLKPTRNRGRWVTQAIYREVCHEHNYQGAQSKAAALWGSGGRAYDRISRSVTGAIEHCVDRLNPIPGERIADVATGTGWASRSVARLGGQVVGVDIDGPLLDAAREITLEQNLAIEYRLGDAEALPLGDGEFDGVISTFGVMFAPDQQRAASELARVCRSGGRLAIAAWLPESNAVKMRQVLQPYAPTPPVAPPSPFVCGGCPIGLRPHWDATSVWGSKRVLS